MASLGYRHLPRRLKKFSSSSRPFSIPLPGPPSESLTALVNLTWGEKESHQIDIQQPITGLYQPLVWRVNCLGCENDSVLWLPHLISTVMQYAPMFQKRCSLKLQVQGIPGKRSEGECENNLVNNTVMCSVNLDEVQTECLIHSSWTQPQLKIRSKRKSARVT